MIKLLDVKFCEAGPLVGSTWPVFMITTV